MDNFNFTKDAFLKGLESQEESYTIPYLRIEQKQAYERMRALGINIEAQTFEQCVNDLLTRLEDKKLTGFYTDGIDHSDLEVNSDQFPENEECVNCGSTSVTITDDKDICHNCGYVYE